MSIKIYKPDGTQAVNGEQYSTSLQSIFLYGETDEPSLEVIYEGVSYSVDLLEDGSFSFPNPSEEIDGFDLSVGSNIFLFRTDTSDLTVNVLLSSEPSVASPNPPTEVKIKREARSVLVSFTDNGEASYYHVYASTVSGGGTLGYRRINYLPIDPITYGSTEEVISEVSALEINTETEQSDPLYVNLSLVQSSITQELGSVSSDQVEIPESASRLRISSSVSTVGLKRVVSFRHDRLAQENSIPPTIRVGEFRSLDPSIPLYYVIKSVSVGDDGQEIESSFSYEVSGKPSDVFSTNISLPVVGKRELTESMIRHVLTYQPEVSVHAGSVFRDVIIDPFVTELERSRFMLDFCYRSSTFQGLLQIDDPTGSGVSIAVDSSTYKRALGQALFLVSNSDIQATINQCFDRLASNSGVYRSIGVPARGEVLFYVTSQPTRTYSVPRNTLVEGAGLSFRTTQEVSIDFENLSSYYDPVKKRWSVACPVIADFIGTVGNLTSGQILSGAPTGMKVINESPLFGGKDAESNIDLASRAISAFTSVDTGTRSGYERISRQSAGVLDSFTVGAGDEYMERDLGQGGKVDVWVKGVSTAIVTDIYAPSYQERFSARFLSVSGEGTYRFVLDSGELIFEMIDRSDLGLGLLNQTSGERFDLTGYTLEEDGRVLVLDASAQTISYRITDVILGDWRGSQSSQVVLRRQPVSSILSVISGDGTSIVDFDFVASEDPIYLGGSSQSNDHIILPTTGRGDLLTVNDESHVVLGSYPEQLGNLGADILSVVVTDLDKLITYNGPYTSSPDYSLERGDLGEIYLKRTSSSSISDGQTVLISYTHRENITITYSTNQVISQVQNDLNASKHLTADVVAKQVISAPVNFKGVVALNRGVSVSSVDTAIKGALSSLVNSFSLGGSLYTSDAVRTIDEIAGVSYVDVPLTEMALSEGTLILREEVSSNEVGSFRQISELSNDKVLVWCSVNNLKHRVEDGGGFGATGVLDTEILKVLSVSSRPFTSNWTQKSLSFIGAQNLKAYVNGTYVEIADTAHRVLLSLPVGEHPSSYSLKVNYRTGNPNGFVSNITLNKLSYFTLGEISFTYEEAR